MQFSKHKVCNWIFWSLKLSTEYEVKFQDMMTELELREVDLPRMLKDLKQKATETVLVRMTAKTPIDKLKRYLEGIYVEIKNISVFISTQAESCIVRRKMRHRLSNLRKKALKIIDLVNSKKPMITVDNFDNGVFPWDNLPIWDGPSTSQDCSLTLGQKYNVIDAWMLRERAKEEIVQTKREVCELLQYLCLKRSSLTSAVQKSRELPEGRSTTFVLGQAMIAQTEVSSLTNLINETLQEFNLHSEDDFEKFRLECPVTDIGGSVHENLDYESNDSDSDDDESHLKYSGSDSESDSYYSSNDENKLP